MEITIKKANSIKGEYTPPPDKSITHRAIILLSISEGVGVIRNPLIADDCLRTLTAMEKMGVKIKKYENVYEIEGVGMKGLKKPSTEIDAGNSGTTVRLLSGILAAQNFEVTIIGDESLSRRPMYRIIKPLRMMGGEIQAREDNYLPMKITGRGELSPIDYTMEIASAQVKSCILFAGMYANGKTTVRETVKSRNHSELMLKYLGAEIEEIDNSISIYGPSKLESKEIVIPGDFSSSAYFIASAILLENSFLTIRNVLLNPTRTGLLKVLDRMGAKIGIKNLKNLNGEIIGDLIVKHSKIRSTEVSQEEIPTLIDEIPILALLATQAEGKTIIHGARELRFKESDRLRTTSTELKKMKADIEETDDGLIINGPKKLQGSEVESYFDHRIAMTLTIAGLISEEKTIIKNAECVEISYPNFFKDIMSLIS